jgi:hypothetical protein
MMVGNSLRIFKTPFLLPASSVIGWAAWIGEPRADCLLEAEEEAMEFIDLVDIDELREAVDGQEAVTLFEHCHPHLIWMDIRMPVMGGLTATRRIKASAAHGRRLAVQRTAGSFGPLDGQGGVKQRPSGIIGVKVAF